MDRLVAMEVFVNVVQAGSFSGGAQRLNLRQPMVSKTVAQLEQHLGVRLLLRSNQGLMLTEPGQRFYDQARIALEQVEASEQAARDASSGVTGRIRVSVPMTFASLTLLPALPRFLDRHPALEVDIMMDDRSTDLLKAGVDVALRIGTLNDSSLVARKLGERPRAVVGTPSYFARFGIPRHPADLASHQAIVYSPRRSGASRTFRRGEEEVTVELSGRVHVDANEGVRAAVLANVGLAVGSNWIFQRDLAEGTVQAVLQDWSLPSADLWALFPTGRMASAKARAFVGFVEEILAASPAMQPAKD
ncbi:LysR family transcriptional regulator [Labrys sp. LIt4]|uniref:LysR family transcriptional regulator n=1 Tax=Labrys sp. LIt4 TaxID=2821355 RepID=UPI001ADEF38F|nr:LysR family transcriptional regulator [Labrys sp. LIt4]MBP0582643.1 LysR family transcriptional regulator [Labrys sp. LIt4]